MDVDFTITFQGGHGMAYTEISIAGNKIGSHTFDESEIWDIALPAGVYVIMLNGVSPPGGTVVQISGTTDPVTPDQFAEGPFRRNYIMLVKNPSA
jgi:hypothetical protein